MSPATTPRRLLIVDDEALVALGIAADCEAGGYVIAGIVGSVAKALAVLDTKECDLAVVDFNLRGQTAEPILIALRAREIPFLILSGYTRQQLPAGYADAPFLTKPYAARELMARLAELGR